MLGIIVKSRSEDQACKSTSKRPLEDMPEGGEEAKKARITALDVDILPSGSSTVPLVTI